MVKRQVSQFLTLINKVNNFIRPRQTYSALTYREAFKLLGQQGVLGFYKGNGIGLIYALTQGTLKSLSNGFVTRYGELTDRNKLVLSLGLSTIIDIALQPLHVVQSRLILQDRRKNFLTYPTALDAFKSIYKQNRLFAGAIGHIPINIALAGVLGVAPKFSTNVFLLGTYLSALCTYPIMTVMRRLECVSNDKGMIRLDYKNYQNTFKTIFHNQGIKGFYQGFSANLFLLTSLTLFTLGSRNFQQI